MNENILPDEELELIGRYARKKLSKDELYTFSLILCDNEIDRDNEKFTVSALKELAELFVGKTGIFDHDMRSKDQTARIYYTEVMTEPGRKTADGEDYTFIKAKAYMVKTEKNKDLIAEIDAGIKKETSVGCSVKSISCSICGRDIKKDGCEHRKGETYGGKLCCYLLSEPADAYEWSFVAVPAQKNAGVTKSFNRSESDGELREWALEYKNELTASVIKDAACVLPEMSSESLKEICTTLGVDKLKQLRDAMKAGAAAKLMPVRQLEVIAEKAENTNTEYKI